MNNLVERFLKEYHVQAAYLPVHTDSQKDLVDKMLRFGKAKHHYYLIRWDVEGDIEEMTLEISEKEYNSEDFFDPEIGEWISFNPLRMPFSHSLTKRVQPTEEFIKEVKEALEKVNDFDFMMNLVGRLPERFQNRYSKIVKRFIYKESYTNE